MAAEELRQIDTVAAAVSEAVQGIRARPQDGSFLERTLRDALASVLPGAARTEQRLHLRGWKATLGGVDVVFDTDGSSLPVGIETKVWDIGDALFDVLKLAAGTQQHCLSSGYCVVAATAKQWRRPSIVTSRSPRDR